LIVDHSFSVSNDTRSPPLSKQCCRL
jgi:hypothetical protein